MIVRTHRFRGRTSVLRALKRGRVIRGHYFSVKYSPVLPGKPWRVAIVVSRKVHKSAVVRNRIRRRLYEQLRLRSDLLQHDLIIIVHSDRTASIPTAELIESLDGILGQITEDVKPTPVV